jgi:hypothetical protein
MPRMDIPILRTEFQHAGCGGHYSISLAITIQRKQKFALSAGKIFTRAWYGHDRPPVDVLKMFCADYSNVFLKSIVLKLVVLYVPI